MRSTWAQNTIVAGLLAAAVGSVGLLAGAQSTAAPTSTGYEYSEAEGYVTLNQVAADAEQVSYFRAESRSVDWIGGVPFTVTTATVTESLTPDVGEGSTIRIRQPGDARVEDFSTTAFLELGRTYAAALAAFHLEPGDDTGEWVIVGDALWQDQPGPGLTVDDEGQETDSLPDVVSDAQIESLGESVAEGG